MYFRTRHKSMAQFLQFPLSYSSSFSPSLLHLKLEIPTNNVKIPTTNRCPIRLCIKPPSALAASVALKNRPFSPIKFASLTALKPYLKPEWRLILSGWLCSAISVYALSKIVPLAGKLSSVVAAANLVDIRNECLVLGVLVLTRTVAIYLQEMFLWEAALRCMYGIRVYVFNRVLQRDLGFFECGSGVLPGDIAHRITAEAEDVADTVYNLLNVILSDHASYLWVTCFSEDLESSRKALVEGWLSILLKFGTIVPSTLQLSAMATQMLVISPVLSLISALVIPSMALSVGCLGERLRSLSNKANISTAALSAYLNEGVGKAYNELKQGEPAIERLFKLTLFESQVIEKPDAVVLDSVIGEVKVCGLSFSYGDTLAPVLNGLDLHIKAGETIALVGPSGGGKTTLVKLLLLLYEPLSGSILIDGYDTRNVQIESLRRHVGLVSQDSVFFSGTVAENIGYSDLISGIDMDKVELAAKTANADEFIKCLPDQYQTGVGPGGSNFSGGQRQRQENFLDTLSWLAIARALYQNPSIIILDEATSALDNRPECMLKPMFPYFWVKDPVGFEMKVSCFGSRTPR
ncbi:hypothetical protein OROMI_012306 [Orobanche minor]